MGYCRSTALTMMKASLGLTLMGLMALQNVTLAGETAPVAALALLA